jgi:hypothetical protein
VKPKATKKSSKQATATKNEAGEEDTSNEQVAKPKDRTSCSSWPPRGARSARLRAQRVAFSRDAKAN